MMLVVVALLAEIGDDLDRRVADVLTAFPGFLKIFWLSGFWLAIGWSIALLIIAPSRGRWQLAVEGLCGAACALLICLVAASLVSGDSDVLIGRLVDSDGPPTFPPGAPAMTTALLVVMAPYLTLPFRRFGRALIAAQMIGAVFLGMSLGLGVFASLAIGLLSGAVVHVVRGSPGGFPTVTRVRSALESLGVAVVDLAPTSMRGEGVAILTGSDGHGALEVRVYGRDAWEGELLADLWRRAWYRGQKRSARPSRAEYVEHEGFMTLLADRGGVHVPEVVRAGLADNGDALIAVRPRGQRLSPTAPALSADQATTLWRELSSLHACGLVHRRIDLDRLTIGDDGVAGFSDLSSASVQFDALDATIDRAQVLALTIVTAGRDAAVATALAVLGRDGLSAVLPYLQPAALPPRVRAALRHQHINLDAIRTDTATSLGAQPEQLANVRRVTWKSLLNLALLAVAAYTLIGLISGLDLGAFGNALADANWWWILAALLIGQLPRPANALSTMGSSPTELAFGPTVALHFATCYVNLAVPSSAGRIAITTRFFQRFGVPPATAISAGLIDSVSEFVVQGVLFLLVFTISDVDLGLSMNADQLSGLATTALIVLGALLLAAAVMLLVPSLRERAVNWYHDAKDALQVLRSPRKLLLLYGGNLLSQLLFAVTLGACARAFGYDIPLSVLILINTVVGLFAGLLPIPGGVGVSEAGLALGLTRAGVPSDTAFAIALTHRFCVFYLPPIWGFRSYRWLTSRGYL